MRHRILAGGAEDIPKGALTPNLSVLPSYQQVNILVTCK
jgi:hypothetical protein